MVTRNMIRIAAVLVVATATLWLAGAPVAASATPTLLTPLPPAEQEGGKAVTIAARLTDGSTNKALGSLDVQFFVMTDVFGPRLMSVGHAITDTTGRAAISYRPSWEGDTKVVARFTGSAQYAATETTFQFVAVGPVPVHQNASFGLEPIRAWAPAVVILLVLGVWATLIAVVSQTVAGLRVRIPMVAPASAPIAGTHAPASAPIAGAHLQPAGEDSGDGAS